jgi:hypothetical protein
MKHPNAACSQQALVMMEVLKKKKNQLQQSWLSPPLRTGSTAVMAMVLF